MEWVEVRGKTVDVAVAAALAELGLEDREQAEIEVLQAPERGFLGIGGRDAIVRVKPRGEGKRRRRRRRGKGSTGGEEAGRQQDRGSKPGSPGERSRTEGRSGGQAQGNDRRRPQERGGAKPRSASKPAERPKKEAPTMEIDEQAPLVDEFLRGLVDAFGLEGEVSVEVDGDVVVADIRGPQTEAMVGSRGRVIEAIHELTKTVLQRQTQSSARVRLDIAGYGERRRQALSIYAGQLIDQVVAEGGEVVLEPMSAADRKVIHDAVAGRQGVRSYSEGESPGRYVVIAATEPAGADEEE